MSNQKIKSFLLKIDTKLFVLYISLAFTGVLAESNNNAELIFRDNVSVNDTVIYLKDIATVACKNQELKNKLKNVSVGVASPAGFSRFINTGDAVNFLISPKFPQVKISVRNHKRISVKTVAEVHKIKDYENKILDWIGDNIKWDTGCWSCEIINPDVSWKVLKKESSVKIASVLEPYAKGNIHLKLEVKQGTKKFNVYFNCKIDVTVPVAVAKKTIMKGELINSDCIVFEPRNITRLNYKVLDRSTDFKDLIAVRTITQGMVLHNRLVKMQPTISKGDNLYITIATGSIRVSVPVRARENGLVGDRIWVENINSHKLLRVVVLGKGRAKFSQGGIL